MTTDPRADAVERNLAEFHRVLATSPLVTTGTHPDVTSFRSGLPHPLFNDVVGARFTPGTERARVEDTVAPFVEAGLPFLWWCGPSTWSEALDRALTGIGAQREDSPGMHVAITADEPADPDDPADLDDPEARAVPGLEIALGTEASDRDVARLMCEVFEIPGSLAAPLRDWMTVFDPACLVHAVASLDGEPVGCGSVWITGRTAGIYNVATLAHARRRGVGYAVTAALLRAGRARGCDESILVASRMGRPVYERLGYVEVCTMPQYVWIPAGS
ncbi:GNAT family N-acetyltransferase [Nocardioides sp. MAHUQ-72]|uniref:GNAT family N-acetyltransferase n=1 Tax=unclassified Nocardioides TaxID=2615069 RepID=UPI0036132D84